MKLSEFLNKGAFKKMFVNLCTIARKTQGYLSFEYLIIYRNIYIKYILNHIIHYKCEENSRQTLKCAVLKFHNICIHVRPSFIKLCLNAYLKRKYTIYM